ncbi:MAG: gamma-glutamyltransferase [Anaerolineae bacterium]
MAISSKGAVHRSTVTGTRGMVSSAHPLASLAGIQMIMKGGNAIDAIVATAAALNVVEPYMSGLAGSGYMHLYSAKKHEHKVIDYMGTAPEKATIDLFEGDEMPMKGPKMAIIPGACAGWLSALENYGTMDPADVFAPAIDYAENGVALTVKNAFFYNWDQPDILKYSAGNQSYFTSKNPVNAGDIVVQKELAETFRKIAKGGADVFYRGEIADRIVGHMQDVGGLINHNDLANLQVLYQDPIHIDYRGHKIYVPEPPCQAIQYLEQLNMLENFDLAQMGHNSAEFLHLFIESAKLTTADRIAYTLEQNGNPSPTSGLISKEYAAERLKEIGDRARPSVGERYQNNKLDGEVEAGDPFKWVQKENTTHFDAIDADGNAVCVTQSLGALFGSSVVVPGTGLALNDFLHWMDPQRDSPNAVGPNKRMEMCMSPVQVWQDDRLRFMVGTPGSYGILQTTPQMIMNVIDHDMNIQAAIEAPRVRLSQQGVTVSAEDRIPTEVLDALRAKGHEFNIIESFSMEVGGGQGVQVDLQSGSFMGGADPRRDGYAIGF